MQMSAKFVLIAFFLVTGSINTLTKKFQFQTCSTGVSSGDELPTAVAKGCPLGQHHFQKPWTQNLCMFLGEAMIFLVFVYRKRTIAKPQEGLSEPLAPKGDYAEKAVPFIVFAMPAFCDVMGTGLGGIGMLYISASVWQMMRGSVIVFTSLLSVMCLGRKLYCYNWLAVAVSVCGLGLVGFSAVLDGGGDSSDVALGIVFTILSQAFTATQMVVEELFVKKYHAPAEQVVGSEGLWGIMIMIALLTAMYFAHGKDVGGSYENAIDSWEMVTNSAPLAGLVLGYLFSISIFNFLGVTISKELSAVHRTINDALRTAIVWGVQLALFYSGSAYGQGPTAHSWMQLLGFMFLVLGSTINHQVLRCPCLYYPPPVSQLRPMGAAQVSPTAGGVSVLSYPDSPLASPHVHGLRQAAENADTLELDVDEI